MTREQPKEQWASLSAQSLMGVGMQWQLALHSDGQWGKMENSFLSLLAHQGTFLQRRGDKRCMLVLKVSQFGLMLIRVPVRASDRTMKVLSDPKEVVCFEVILRPSEFRVAEPVLYSPGQIEGEGCAGRIGGVFGPSFTLLGYAARKGFKNFTVPQLRRLAKTLQVDGVRSSMAEHALVELLVKFALKGEFTADLLAQALKARGSQGFEPIPVEASGLLHSGIQELLDEECDDESDLHDQWQQIKKKCEARRIALKKAQEEAAARMPAAPASASASSSSARPVVAAAPSKPRRFVPAEADGYSAAEAAQFLPPGATITKDSTRENRWRVRASFLSNLGSGCERSKSFGRGSKLTDFEAMLFCLQLVWRSYLLRHGGQCPFKWDDMRAAPQGSAAPPAAG